MEILQALASIYQVRVDDLYEKDSDKSPEAIPGTILAVYEYRLAEIHEIYEEGDKEEAYLKLVKLSEEMLDRLTDMTEEFHRLKGKLQTVRDLINL